MMREVPIAKRLSVRELVEELARLDDTERVALCDALVDDPRLRSLLETIDDYLYLEPDDLGAPSFLRELN